MLYRGHYIILSSKFNSAIYCNRACKNDECTNHNQIRHRAVHIHAHTVYVPENRMGRTSISLANFNREETRRGVINSESAH
jgi:hypothetical protein